MSEHIVVDKFKGMNNVNPLNDLASPHVAHNVDITQQGSLKKRDGYAKIATLIGAHSLFAAEGFLYCIAEGSAYKYAMWRIAQSGDKTEIAEVVGNNVVSNLKLENLVYLSSTTWTKILNLTTATINNWGVPVPKVAPDVSVG